MWNLCMRFTSQIGSKAADINFCFVGGSLHDSPCFLTPPFFHVFNTFVRRRYFLLHITSLIYISGLIYLHIYGGDTFKSMTPLETYLLRIFQCAE